MGNAAHVKKAQEERALGLMQQVYSSLKSLLKKMDKRHSQSAYPLTGSQYAVLLAIRCGGEDAPTIISVARRICASKQNVNQMVPLLERKGFVSRSVWNEDKRAVHLHVTEAGMQAMDAYEAAHADALRQIFKDFTEQELDALLQQLKKLEDHKGEEA